MITLTLFCLLAVLTGAAQEKSFKPFKGKKSEWRGCKRYDFKLQERDVIVVVPHTPLPGNPWVWRPAFFDAFPAIDEALLEAGFHITYYDTTNEWGRPEAIEAGEKFYDLMVNTHGLMPRVTLEGLSRGGFYSLRWGETHPETVACLLLDNPLCDVFELSRNDEWWGDFLQKWHIESATRESFKENATLNLHRLIDHRVPIIALSGGTDTIVSYERNAQIIVEAYERWGIPVKSIVRPHSGHHPHGLDNPAPIVSYLKRLIYPEEQEAERPVRIACVGNSITEGVGTTDASRYAYPAVLQRMLGDGYEVRNFGVSCSTVLRKGTDAGRPFAYIDTEAFRQALAYQPDVVVLKLGGNDSKPDNWAHREEFVRDYQELVDAFKFLPSLPKIYLCLPAKADTVDASKVWGINERIIRDEITPLVARIAHDNRLTTINLHNAYAGEENACYHDHIHPNNRGAELLAKAIYKVLRGFDN
ncbi:MAG: hypothetical protein IJ511_03515 [Bacteroides sp.]|nr:hypothetical protein [Bacteroides sp.]